MPRNNKNVLRIAMLGHKRIPSREGGVEIVVEELATRMHSMGHFITCYNRKGHHVSGADFDGAAISDYKGIRIKTVLTVNKKGLAAMSSSFFASLCAAFGKYDVVHFHAEGPCAMLWLVKLFGKRCIATVHGLDHKRAKWGKLASLYIRMGEKCAVKYADEIIVLSESVKQYFLDTYNRKTVFIPNGVSRPEHITAKEITRLYGLCADDYILFLGRLVPEKGLECLINAYKELKTDKKLVIAGGASDTGEFEEHIKALAKEDDRIIFTGFVQGRVLEELYSNSYIYVLPSSLEGMPLSLLEAMSYSNCCLTSDIPECTEVTNNCGVSFRVGDVAALTAAMRDLCDNPLKVKKLKSQSADYICSRYNWDDVAEQTVRLYYSEKTDTPETERKEKNEHFARK